MVNAIGISTPPAKPCRPRSAIIVPEVMRPVNAQAIEKIANRMAC